MKLQKMMLPIALALVSGAFLSSAEPQWGVQGGLVFPSGDLSYSAGPGLDAGGHARWNFGEGHGLMARADLTVYGQSNGNSDSSIGVGADYTYHVNRAPRGLYLLGGLSVVATRWTPWHGQSRSDTNLGLDLGLGYDLNRSLGFQLRSTTHGGSGGNLDALRLGATLSF